MPSGRFTSHSAVVAIGLAIGAPRRFAGMALAVAYPPSRGFNGASTSIEDLSKHGLYSGNLGITPDKRTAVQLIMDVRMQNCNSYGKGNRAVRRARALDDMNSAKCA